MNHVAQPPRHPVWRIGLFVFITIAGLFYVKWSPYYDRAFIAANTQSIGLPIVASNDGTIPAPSLSAALNYAVAYGLAIWKALLLGLLVGSGLNALLSANWIQKILGARNMGSVIVGSLLSVPSMMCTCCAAPVVNGLRQCQAAPGSTVAYWLGNTMLNPATLVFMGFVLGWHWVGFRLAIGLVMVIGLGWVLNRISDDTQTATVPGLHVPLATQQHRHLSAFTVMQRWGRSFVGMAIRLLPEYLVLVLLLGAARAWLFPMLDMNVDNTVLWIGAAAIAGLLFVIPTAGEVPIAQTMLMAGGAVGPVAALLVTLPPVSLPSLTMVARSFQRTHMVILIGGVLAIGILAGFLAVALGF